MSTKPPSHLLTDAKELEGLLHDFDGPTYDPPRCGKPALRTLPPQSSTGCLRCKAALIGYERASEMCTSCFAHAWVDEQARLRRAAEGAGQALSL